ncbi:MAG: hypothetical protein FWD45_06885, partial [Coriobacteriia bacterium]|nr:hypothetical protein [Coriobacteriia bacterium]
ESVQVSSDGSVYALGTTSSAETAYDVIIRYDSELNQLAFLSSQTTPYDDFRAIALAPDGSVYVSYSGGEEIDYDMGVVKYRSDLVEIASIVTTAWLMDMVVSQDGTLYAVGTDITYDESRTPVGIVVKYDSELNRIGSAYWNYGQASLFHSLAVATDGSVYTLANTYATPDTDDPEAYLVKFDSNLTQLNQITRKENLYNNFTCLVVDSSGAVFVVFNSSSATTTASCLIKFDPDLNEIDSLATNEIRSDYFTYSEFPWGVDISALAIDSEGFIYAAGSAGTTGRGSDPVIVLLNNDLKIANIVVWPGSNDESLVDIALSADAQVYTVGEVAQAANEGAYYGASGSSAIIMK